MRIKQIWRYPVKSVGGHQVAAATVTDIGIEGDRSWGIVDDATGNVLTGRREPRLLLATATLGDDGPAITADGSRPMTTSEELSVWLGRSVTLARAGQEGGTYENPLDYENDDNWMSWQGPGGAWHDSDKARLSIASLATMGDWDPRRFRMNLVVDGEGEDEFVDHRITAGAVVLFVVKPITRCVMVTRPQPRLERNLDVLKTINRTRNSTLGIGAVVISGGRLVEGDELALA